MAFPAKVYFIVIFSIEMNVLKPIYSIPVYKYKLIKKKTILFVYKKIHKFVHIKTSSVFEKIK